MTEKKDGLSYRDAGVDIDAGNELVNRIKESVQRTQRPEVLGGLGGFGGAFALPSGYKEPVLISGTDGVGTKLRVAMELNQHDTIGIDLVAMCVNDLIVTGAEPLFFLDYYATGKLNVDVAADVVSGIAEGCEQAGCALIGGETAEMPGMYQGDDYDLAGFCVGIVERKHLIDGSRVEVGNALIALGSSGPHSNGYSLIRRILDQTGADMKQSVGTEALGEALLAPTRIYVKPLMKLLDQFDVRAMAHITGGGLTENIPRVLPENTEAVIDTHSWAWPDVFQWLQRAGNVDTGEMFRTFNCGVGMVICILEADRDQVLETLNDAGEDAWLLGHVQESEGEPQVRYVPDRDGSLS